MNDSPSKRRVFWDRADIPSGTKALVINIKNPILTLIATEQPDDRYKIFDRRIAYVEITREEWAAVKDDPQKADALARKFGELVQEEMGASWHRWHDSNS